MSQLEDLLVWQLRMAKLPPPLLEYKFHSIRLWRFDLCWPALMLACEVEGGVWNGGRHVTGKGFSGDCEKASEAAIAGWLVLRVTGDQIKSGDALKWLERALNANPGDKALRDLPKKRVRKPRRVPPLAHGDVGQEEQGRNLVMSKASPDRA